MGLYSNEIAKKITIFIPPKKTDMKINFFNNIKQTKPEATTSILEFLNNVKLGTWRDKIEPINAETDPDKVKELKNKTLPYVTISGTFNQRNDSSLIKHSGFICLDLDKLVDLDKEWEKIINDPYTFGAFKSASGRGIAVLVKIKTNKHKESFLSLESYYLEKYSINIDKACKDISRPRYVSYDPETFVNQEAETFDKFVKEVKKKIQIKLPVIITGKDDLDNIIEQVKNSNIDLSGGDYNSWRDIGFALASELGEGGRDHFHVLSSMGEGYDPQKCNKQYDNCVKSDGSGIRINTLFYYAKQANLTLVSAKTKHIVAAAKQGKRGGRTAEDVTKLLETVGGINKEESEEIVNKVFKSNVDLRLTEELSVQEQVEVFISNEYNLKCNEITGKIENNGIELSNKGKLSMYFQVKRIVSNKFPKSEVIDLINSDFVPDYNPIKEFINKNKNRKTNGAVEKLIKSIVSPTGIEGPDSVNPNFKSIFITKWLVGMIQSLYGKHSPLVLVLTGGQGEGKSHFFEHLLPEELSDYYVKDNFLGDKDFEILMTKKLLILDDEWGGKTKKEAAKFKAVTSKEKYELRKAYAPDSQMYNRLAVIAGTTNEVEIMNDPTGNRRIIPIEVETMDRELYNSINKTDLFIEIYNLYEAGENTDLTREQINLLNHSTTKHKELSNLGGLISLNFKPGEEAFNGEPVLRMTTTQISEKIKERSQGNINFTLKTLGMELKALGFESKKSGPMRYYNVVLHEESDHLTNREDPREGGYAF